MRKLSGLFLVLVLAILLSSCGIVVQNTALSSGQQGETELPTISQSKVDWFISEYNSTADKPITGISEFNVKDKGNGHYRTEFRLGAFDEAEAKTGKIGDIEIDIVAYGYSIKSGGYSNEDLRIYVSEITSEQAREIMAVSLPILDSNLTDAEIEEVLRKVDEKAEINGYYGVIGITWIKGDLMLKVE